MNKRGNETLEDQLIQKEQTQEERIDAIKNSKAYLESACFLAWSETKQQWFFQHSKVRHREEGEIMMSWKQGNKKYHLRRLSIVNSQIANTLALLEREVPSGKPDEKEEERYVREREYYVNLPLYTITGLRNGSRYVYAVVYHHGLKTEHRVIMSFKKPDTEEEQHRVILSEPGYGSVLMEWCKYMGSSITKDSMLIADKDFYEQYGQYRKIQNKLLVDKALDEILVNKQTELAVKKVLEAKENSEKSSQPESMSIETNADQQSQTTSSDLMES